MFPLFLQKGFPPFLILASLDQDNSRQPHHSWQAPEPCDQIKNRLEGSKTPNLFKISTIENNFPYVGPYLGVYEVIL